MTHTKKIFFLLFFITFSLLSQDKKTISGTIYDESNNETLIGVSLYFPELNSGTTTNEYGFYSVTLPKGTYKIQVSYLGYSSIVASITLNENKTKNFKLIEETESLEEIVIESNIEKLNVRTPQMSINKLTSATIKNIPVVLGEADIIKSLILLPGVTSAGEGASGF
ncbi:MAG: carboxypeptidase-like regulatory domain-containing protein, partial [Polaribacter sp.]|nr:carboxypeptidase-like regulatory domain-containing protein [Polaribacter sp.]